MGISTDQGLYISINNGDSFTLVSDPQPVINVEIRENSILYFSLKGDTSSLIKYDLNNNREKTIPLPDEVNENNPVLYISSHPENEEVMTMVTHKNDIYQTIDVGQSWITLSSKGQYINNTIKSQTNLGFTQVLFYS